MTKDITTDENANETMCESRRYVKNKPHTKQSMIAIQGKWFLLNLIRAIFVKNSS